MHYILVIDNSDLKYVGVKDIPNIHSLGFFCQLSVTIRVILNGSCFTIFDRLKFSVRRLLVSLTRFSLRIKDNPFRQWQIRSRINYIET